MIGSALGDAIGELAFDNRSKDSLLSTLAQQATLVYTDDTAMMLGLAESILAVGGLDPCHLGDTFRANFQEEPWRGYALGPPAIFRRVEREGISYEEAAQRLFGGTGSYGNGAAMRVAPVGLFCYDYDAPDLYEQARLSAIVTHTHPVGIDGAAVRARAVALAVRSNPKASFHVESFLQDLIEFARTRELQEKLEQVGDLLAEDATPSKAAQRLGRGVAVHQSLPFALYAFLRHPRSFMDCLFCAVLHGGDADTLGAMACAVSGAYLGVQAIPHQWQERLENRKTTESLAQRLAEARAHSRAKGGKTPFALRVILLQQRPSEDTVFVSVQGGITCRATKLQLPVERQRSSFT